MAAVLIICVAVFMIGAGLKAAYVIGGFLLKVTGLLFMGFTAFYLVCAMIGVDYHQFFQ